MYSMKSFIYPLIADFLLPITWTCKKMTMKRVNESSIVNHYFGGCFEGLLGFFIIGWMIYGAVFFFPEADGPYTPCERQGGQEIARSNKVCCMK